MKKSIIFISLLLVIMMILAACSNSTNYKQQETMKEDVSVVETKINNVNVGSLSLEKVASLPKDFPTNYEVYHNGIVYSDKVDNETKYGVCSLDEKFDSGAIYYYAQYANGYYVVSKGKDLNTAGLIDYTGKEVIPCEYSLVKVVNDKYAYVCNVSGETTNKEYGLMFSSDNSFSISYNEDNGDVLYKGTWYLFNLTDGTKIKGASGNKARSISSIFAYGNSIMYADDNETKHYLNSKYESLKEGTKLLDYGSYVTDDVVYSEDGNELFELEPMCSVSEVGNNRYLIANNQSQMVYYLYDDTGNKISADFEKNFRVCEDLIITYDNKLCDYEGNVIIDDEVSTASFDKLTNKFYHLFIKDGGSCVIDKLGNKYYSVPKDSKEFSDNSEEYVSYKVSNDEKLFYSYKDNDYVMEGLYNRSKYLICQSIDGTPRINIFDVLSNTQLLQDEFYDSCEGQESMGDYYLISCSRSDGPIDIYKVTYSE